MTDNLRDALDSWPEPEGSFDEVLEQSAQRVFNDGAAHPVEPAPGVSDEVTFQAMRAFDGKAGYSKLERLRAALEAALSLQQPECGAEGPRGRCVFTPGHHEAEFWTSHGDRGGWTWNDPPARLPKSGAELSAASIAVHRAKRQACLDYGIGHHDCSEHGG